MIDTPPMRAGPAPIHRLGRRLHPVAARRGDGDGVARRGAGYRRAGDRLARAPIRCPRRASPRRGTRCWTAGRTGATRHRRPGARRWGRRRSRARHGGRRAAGPRRAAGRTAVRDPGSRASRPGPGAGSGGRRGGTAAGGGGARVLRHAAGRRDRVRQDRGLSRGGGGMPAPGPPGAGAAAGDRAVLAVAGALRAPLRRGAGGVALRPDLAGPPRDLARGGRGRRAGGGGRPVGAVPAVSRPRPGGDRRGARDRVQAGGRRGLSRPRHGGGARPVLLGAGGAGVRHAVAGDAGQRRGRPLPPAHPADAAWRGGAARGGRDRHAGDAAGAGALPRPAADRGDPRHAGARRAGDAVPQPPRLRAADAVPALRAPDAVPELHRLAGGAPRPARAAMPPLRPHRADPGGMPGLRARRTAWCRWVRGWSASPRRPPRCSPTRAGW